MELDIIKGKKVAELREIAKALKIPGAAQLKKKEIIDILTRMHEEAEAQRAAMAQEEAPQEAAVSEEPAPAPKKRRGRPPKKKPLEVQETEAPCEKQEAPQPEARLRSPLPLSGCCARSAASPDLSPDPAAPRP